MFSAVFLVNQVCDKTYYHSAWFSFTWKREAFGSAILKLFWMQTRFSRSHWLKDDKVSETCTKDWFCESPDRCSRKTDIWVTILQDPVSSQCYGQHPNCHFHLNRVKKNKSIFTLKTLQQKVLSWRKIGLLSLTNLIDRNYVLWN